MLLCFIAASKHDKGSVADRVNVVAMPGVLGSIYELVLLCPHSLQGYLIGGVRIATSMPHCFIFEHCLLCGFVETSLDSNVFSIL